MTVARRIPLLIAFSLLGGCGAVDPPAAAASPRTTPAPLYGGPPYEGTLEATVRAQGQRERLRIGEGSARFVDTGGNGSRLVVRGVIDDAGGDAGFEMPGRSDQGGWSGQSGDIRLAITPDGRISGGGATASESYRFSGRLSEGRFQLLTEIDLRQASRSGMPAGTRFQFEYDLSRRPPSAVRTADKVAGNAAKKKCRKIRYEMRPVANTGDGTMGMIQVPICLD